ncbi:MAG: hypothetical protein J7L89_03715 [Bacteroidales bacterium]|nr:hypothetical protein [Bacteroidales bacterium]
MRRIIYFFSVIGISATAFLLSAGSRSDTLINPEQVWIRVDSFEQHALYRSAFREVDNLFRWAIQHNQTGQEIKALIYRLKYITKLNDDGQLKAWQELNRLLPDKRPVPGAIKQSMRAQLTDRFFRKYQWKISQNPIHSGHSSADPYRWSPEYFYSKILKDYLGSLNRQHILTGEKSHDYASLLTGSLDDTLYLPRLYDVLVMRALRFLESSGRFTVSLPDTVTGPAPAIRHILTRWIQNIDSTAQPELFYFARLQQIRLLHKFEYTAPDRDSVYIHALKKLRKDLDGDSLAAQIDRALAVYYRDRGDRWRINGQDTSAFKWDSKKALKYALRGSQFDSTRSGRYCRQMSNSLKKKELRVQCEPVLLPGYPIVMSLEYRNLPLLYYRVIRVDGAVYYHEWSGLNSNRILHDALKKPVLRSGSIHLPDDGDLHFHRVNWILGGLPPDGYMVLFSDQDDWEPARSAIIYQVPFQVSSIAWIERADSSGGRQFWFLSRKDGARLGGVTARIWYRQFDRRVRQNYLTRGPEIVAGDNGLAVIREEWGRQGGGAPKSYRLELRYHQETLWTPELFFPSFPLRRPTRRIKALLYSDRSIYRPGQTLKFRGIMLQDFSDSLAVYSEDSIKITLQDPKYRIQWSTWMKPDSLGVFSGEASLPLHGLTGNYTLNTRYGSLKVRVERYRRPQISVILNPDHQYYHYGDSMMLSGKVVSLSGEPVNGAKVRIAVLPDGLREVTISTDRQGRYSYRWRIPDNKGSFREYVSTRYRIRIRAQDMNGETSETGQAIRVGRGTVHLYASLPSKIEKTNAVSFNLRAVLPDGRPGRLPVRIRWSKLVPADNHLIETVLPLPDRFLYTPEEWRSIIPEFPYRDEYQINRWSESTILYDRKVLIDSAAAYRLDFKQILKPGWYRLVIETADSTVPAHIVIPVQVVHSHRVVIPSRTDWWSAPLPAKLQVGETLKVLQAGRWHSEVLVRVSSLHGTLYEKWVNTARRVSGTTLKVTPQWQGGVAVEITGFSRNRLLHEYHKIEVPWLYSQLNIRWLKLLPETRPGDKVTIQLQVTDQNQHPVLASLGVVVYDASLDRLQPHHWLSVIWPDYHGRPVWQGGTITVYTGDFLYRQPVSSIVIPLHQLLDLNWFGFGTGGMEPAMVQKAMAARPVQRTVQKKLNTYEPEGIPASGKPEITKEYEPVIIRKDFRETAFFAGQIQTDRQGKAAISFTVPEVFTTWKIMALAHDQKAASAITETKFQSRSALMIKEHYPRYVWTGDTLHWAARVGWYGNDSLPVISALSFTNNSGSQIGSFKKQQLMIPSQEAVLLTWKSAIQRDRDFLFTLNAVGPGASDGLTDTIHVQRDRITLWNSQPFFLQPGQERTIVTGDSVNQLFFELTTSPLWYVFRSLPLIRQYELESSSYWFTRFYLACLIGRTGQLFPQATSWFLNQPLSVIMDSMWLPQFRNQELRNPDQPSFPGITSLEDEKQRVLQIRSWLDPEQRNEELAYTFDRLYNLQMTDGSWPWFRSMPSDVFMTQMILHGIGELKKWQVADVLKTQQGSYMIKKAIQRMDHWMSQQFKQLQKRDPDLKTQRQLSSLIIHYLYTRTLYPSQPIQPADEIAYLHFLDRMEKEWVLHPVELQVIMAITAHELGHFPLYDQIMASLRERLAGDSESGLHLPRKDRKAGWAYWDLTAQSRLIELFGLDQGNKKELEGLRIYLLKQKRTRDWGNGYRAIMAARALLFYGSGLNGTEAALEVDLGNLHFSPLRIQTGLREPYGYYRYDKDPEELNQSGHTIRFKEYSGGLVWGTVHALEKHSIHTLAASKGPMTLNRTILRQTVNGEWQEVNKHTQITVGEKLLIRLEINNELDMSYLCMEDHLGTGWKPVGWLSGYYYDQGMGYYRAQNPGSLLFYLSFLPRGSHVLTYQVIAEQGGDYAAGYAQVQSFYAPEYSAWSVSGRLHVFGQEPTGSSSTVK